MKTIILLASTDDELNHQLIDYAQQYRKDTEWVLPSDERAPLAEAAACWFPDQDTLFRFPNLAYLQALSAGVDHLGDALLSSGLPICRIVDENQKQGMFEYVLWGILNAHRHFDRMQENQKLRRFQRYTQKPATEIRVCVLGLGMLGKHVAQSLAALGYSVSGWSKSLKSIDKVRCFAGAEAFSNLLPETDILVNLLPLNPITQHILNKSVFDRLPKGAYLINCGRGGHVKEDDLLGSINSGHLRGALLDVFDEEPLPESSLFWNTKGIIVTPHMASEASIASLVNQTTDNIKQFQTTGQLHNEINTNKGY